MYKGLIRDRLQTLPTYETRIYQTYLEAHKAAEKLEKKHARTIGIFVNSRYEIDVIKL